MNANKRALRLFLLAPAGAALACNLSFQAPLPATEPAIATAGIPDATPTGGPSQAVTPLPAEADWPPTVDEILADCPTAEEIAEVDSRIALHFDTDPTAGELVCTAAAGSADLTRAQKNIYNAILIMKHLEFDAPLPWTGQSLYDWFTGAIAAIRLRSDIASSSCCGNPPTIQLKAELHAFYSDRWTAVGGLVSLFAHEARHTYMAHVCHGLDNSIAEMGAYGVEALLHQWLAYHGDPDFLTALNPGPTKDYREASRFAYDALRRNMFCAEPTPEGLPPELPLLPAADTAVWTEKILRAARSGVPIPVPISPAADGTAPVQGTVFTWQSVDFPGGVTYGVEVDALFHFGKDWEYWQARTDAVGLSATSYAMPIAFDPSYNPVGRWRVWAISPTDGPGPKSEWNYFRVEG